MIKGFSFWFPLLLFVVIRQFYANLLGINRDLLTALMLVLLTVFGLVAFCLRLQEDRPDFLLIDAITVTQFFIASVAILGYFVTYRVESNEAAASFYYYCLAPFLIYAGFIGARFRPLTKRALLVAAGCVYGVTVWVAAYECLGIDFWLFEYDRWELQKNFAGVARASGLYGTQIDYGLLSFMAFSAAFYANVRRRHWFSTIVATLAALGVLLTMSRIWIAAMVMVVLVHATLRRSFTLVLKLAAALAIMAAVLYPLGKELGIVSILVADDKYTQDSNYSRVEQYSKMPKLLLHDYLFEGTGPGTQNGPDARGQKFATDFLWLGYLVDFGSIIGGLLLLLRVALLLYVLCRCSKSVSNSSLRPLTAVLCISFFLASFVDSAYAHPISVSAFYVIAGGCLHQDHVLIAAHVSE